MTPERFAYWLQGIAETSEGPPTEKQWQIIKDHLAEVFTKVTPDRDEPSLSDEEREGLKDAFRPSDRARRGRGHEYDLLIC